MHNTILKKAISFILFLCLLLSFSACHVALGPEEMSSEIGSVEASSQQPDKESGSLETSSEEVSQDEGSSSSSQQMEESSLQNSKKPSSSAVSSKPSSTASSQGSGASKPPVKPESSSKNETELLPPAEESSKTESSSVSSSRPAPPAESSSKPTEEKPDAESAKFIYIAYESLVASEKKIYDAMVKGFSDVSASFNVDRVFDDVEDEKAMISRVFECILADRPEIFHVQRISYTIRTNTIEVKPNYQYNKQTYENMLKAAKDVAADWLKKAPKNGDYAKSKWVYEQIITRTDYNLSANNNQNFYSVFVLGESVCAGYASASQYLLQQLGVSSVVVRGVAQNQKGSENHAWNLNILGDKYYYFDATWGDPSYDGKSKNYVSYAYLNVTTDYLFKSHTPQGNGYPLPACTAKELNYYLYEGYAITSYDDEKIQQSITDQMKADKLCITLRFEVAEEFTWFMSAVKNNNHLSSLLSTAFKESGKSWSNYNISYITYDALGIIEIILTPKG